MFAQVKKLFTHPAQWCIIHSEVKLVKVNAQKPLTKHTSSAHSGYWLLATGYQLPATCGVAAQNKRTRPISHKQPISGGRHPLGVSPYGGCHPCCAVPLGASPLGVPHLGHIHDGGAGASAYFWCLWHCPIPPPTDSGALPIMSCHIEHKS